VCVGWGGEALRFGSGVHVAKGEGVQGCVVHVAAPSAAS
jgi:hypothetical protein